MLGITVKNAIAAVFAFVLASALTTAQAQAPEVGLVFHPGDKVTVGVSFKSPVAVEGGRFYFQLQGAPPHGQEAFVQNFQSNDFHKISDTECEFSGNVSQTAASGTYLLAFVEVSTQGVSRRYDSGTGFKNEISIHIENPKRVDFPEIKAVTVRP